MPGTLVRSRSWFLVLGFSADRESTVGTRRRSIADPLGTFGTGNKCHRGSSVRLEQNPAGARKKERRTKAAPSTPAKGPTEQHMADAPLRERGPRTASVDQGPEGPSWRF